MRESRGVGSALYRMASIHSRLTPDVVLNDRGTCVTSGAYKMRTRPQRTHIAKVRELLPQHAGCIALHHLDDLGSADVRRHADEQVNVIGHYFHSSDFAAQFGDTLNEQLIQSGTNGADQNLAAVLRTPNDMVIDRVNAVPLMRVFHSNHLGFREVQFENADYLSADSATPVANSINQFTVKLRREIKCTLDDLLIFGKGLAARIWLRASECSFGLVHLRLQGVETLAPAIFDCAAIRDSMCVMPLRVTASTLQFASGSSSLLQCSAHIQRINFPSGRFNSLRLIDGKLSGIAKRHRFSYRDITAIVKYSLLQHSISRQVSVHHHQLCSRDCFRYFDCPAWKSDLFHRFGLLVCGRSLLLTLRLYTLLNLLSRRIERFFNLFYLSVGRTVTQAVFSSAPLKVGVSENEVLL